MSSGARVLVDESSSFLRSLSMSSKAKYKRLLSTTISSNWQRFVTIKEMDSDLTYFHDIGVFELLKCRDFSDG